MNANSSNSSFKAIGAYKKTRTRKAKVNKKQGLTSDLCENLEKPAESVKINDIALNCTNKSAESIVFENIVKLGRIELTLPIRTVSEANNFDPWQKKHKRHKAQKRTVFFALVNLKRYITLPCTITFVRYAPKPLDKHDNLPMSLKWICDSTCAEITGEHRPGLADNFQDININYGQVISKTYAVKIIIDYQP